MSEEKIYDLLEKMYIEFTRRFEKIDSRMDGFENRLGKFDSRMDKFEIRLENEVIGTIQILLEGHQLHTEQLRRIEDKVSAHEEKFFRKIK
ncbi:MAG: hypothetical protein WDA53_07940 [Bacillota bacterium]